MSMILSIPGQVNQIKLSPARALWPLFETVINSIQSLEESDVSEKTIHIYAKRSNAKQIVADDEGTFIEKQACYESFIVTDNGDGFNTKNYASFLEAYSQLKMQKGCKGIGRFLWLKAFDKVNIKSHYIENGDYHLREFGFSLRGIEPEQNDVILSEQERKKETKVVLDGFKKIYREAAPSSLESLAKKLIEHCLPYFITEQCPSIILEDSYGERYILNEYYQKTYKDSLHQDEIDLEGQNYTLYHMLLSEGVDKHELHLCANNREVKSYNLSAQIPDLHKKLSNENGSYYYIGYLAGDYLDKAVTTERADFNFADSQLSSNIGENEIVSSAIEHIKLYLYDDLSQIAEAKKKRIDLLVKSKHPQYRLLLNRNPDIYDKIPAGLSEDKLEIELYKHQQKWELEISRKRHDIEEQIKRDSTADPAFKQLFDDYCENITELNRASLAEYVIHRKAVIDLFEKALEVNSDGNYSLEERIHSIICPMQTSSNEIEYNKMNLWLIDDRLAYHHYLSSDMKFNAIPVLDCPSDKRMDLAIFDAALSYSIEQDSITSITIVEFKRPMRDDDKNDPVWQVLKYVRDIKAGKIKKANGREYGDMSKVAFYCYVIGDMTPSMRDSAERSGLTEAQDKEGYFGYNPTYGAYVEVISYDKMLKDAKQRNRSLFDKLFDAKASQILHPEYIGK